MHAHALLLAAVLVLSACASSEANYVRDFVAAEREARTFAPITEIEPAIGMGAAYALQRSIVSARVSSGDTIAGYKGGLMSAKSLADRGVSEPVTGVLFTSGALASGADVYLCSYRRAAFEMKIGYYFSAPVTAPVTSIDALRALVGAVAPVVELPDIAYRDATAYGAIDMVAANVSSAKFVVGERRAPDIDLDEVVAAMTRDGAPVTQGRGRESLGAQWESLRTVVNLVVARGERIAPSMLVLTGKIGDKGDIGPGSYQADYGALGRVVFRAQACSGRPG